MWLAAFVNSCRFAKKDCRLTTQKLLKSRFRCITEEHLGCGLWVKHHVNKRHIYWRVSPLLAQRKSIFYLTLELLRGYKLLLLYSTCLWRSPIQLDHLNCICVCVCFLYRCVFVHVSAHILSDVSPALLSCSCMRGKLQCYWRLTITILQLIQP